MEIDGVKTGKQPKMRCVFCKRWSELDPATWNDLRLLLGVMQPGQGAISHDRNKPFQQAEGLLPVHGRQYEVRGRRKAEQPGGLPDAVGGQVVPLSRRQVGGAVANAPNDAVRQQVGQGSVNRGVRLSQDARQLRRIDEGRPADGVE